MEENTLFNNGEIIYLDKTININELPWIPHPKFNFLIVFYASLYIVWEQHRHVF